MQFGTALRLLRIDAGVGLRELARSVGVSSAYLSRVENGHDPAPTPDRLVAIAGVLDVSPALLIELADQAGAAVAGYLAKVPAAAALFLDIARRNLGPAEVARVKAFIEREQLGAPESAPPRRGTPRLSSLLTAERIVPRLTCHDLATAIELAVARGLAGDLSPRAVAGRILEREREAPTVLGDGVAVPHAVVRDTPTSAALVSLARPLALDTPDGKPVRLAVVLVSRERGRRYLEVLGQIARLSSQGLAAELAPMREPRRILDRLRALEAV